MSHPAPSISIVIPLYNESLVFQTLITRINQVLVSVSQQIEVVLIDDGSQDHTADLIRATAHADPRFQAVILSRNHGHQLALTAGLHHARGTDAIMVIDGDLQDPPELLATFYAHVKKGADVVYGIRKKRKEGPTKRLAYWLFYRLQRRVTSIHIPLDAGDFCMMSRRVVDQLKMMPEESRYLRGMRSWVGFKQVGIAYERQERSAGNSNYSLRQLMKLAFNGIFNFSDAPIRFISRLGIVTISISLIYLGITLYKKIFVGDVPLGFTALIMAIVLFSGVQLISLGIIGEYVLRIFFQVKQRPLFTVSEHIVEGQSQR